jgi:hypothetical protein
MLGGFLGWQGAIGTLMIASVIGTVIGLSMIGYFRMKGDAPAAPEEETPANAEPKPAKTGEDSDDEEITLEGHYLPFGPYLAVGGLIYLFIGPELLAWYIARISLPPIVPGVTPLGM